MKMKSKEDKDNYPLVIAVIIFAASFCFHLFFDPIINLKELYLKKRKEKKGG